MEMNPNQVNKSAAVNMTAGQTLSIKVLNVDGTVASVVMSEVVPAGKAFTGAAYYSGTVDVPV